jgi:hypothetical protein
MSVTELPIEQCEVFDQAALTRSRAKRQVWERWLHRDPNHAIWPQIASMLLHDLTFRTLATAADADEASALHSPIIRSGVVLGYAASQGLAIRRLVDMTGGVISLRRLNRELRNNRDLLTREIFVSGFGVPYDPDAAYAHSFSDAPAAAGTISWVPMVGPSAFVPSMGLHERFDRLSGVTSGRRARGDRIQKRIFERIEGWLTAPEISAVVTWSHNTLAHASDRPTNLSSAAPTFEAIAAAQRDIVRAAVAISTHILHGPVLGEIVPVLQYNQFHRFDRVVSDPAVQKMAAQRWLDLADERNRWGRDVFDALVA